MEGAPSEAHPAGTLASWSIRPLLTGAIFMDMGKGSSDFVFRILYYFSTYKGTQHFINSDPTTPRLAITYTPTAVLRVASPAWWRKKQPLASLPVYGCATPWQTWVSRSQPFSDSSRIWLRTNEGSTHWPRLRCLGHYKVCNVTQWFPRQPKAWYGVPVSSPSLFSARRFPLSPLQSYCHLTLDYNASVIRISFLLFPKGSLASLQMWATSFSPGTFESSSFEGQSARCFLPSELRFHAFQA